MPKITITSDSALDISINEKETIGGIQYQPLCVTYNYPKNGQTEFIATLVDVDTFVKERSALPHIIHPVMTGDGETTFAAADGAPVTENDILKYITENYPNVIMTETRRRKKRV